MLSILTVIFFRTINSINYTYPQHATRNEHLLSSNMNQLRRISGFLGLQKSTVGMLFMVILVGMGERMAAFGGAFLWLLSPQVNFLTAFAFGVIGTIGLHWRVRSL